MERKVIGYFSENVVKILSLSIKAGTPIYISDTNITHIREKHTDVYIKYFGNIEEIIKEPDYIGIAGVHAPSIEYIKRFDWDGKLVNVAVRATKSGIYYLRSMFIIENGRLNDYLKRGLLFRT